MVIGITGNIGSGKSTAAKYLAEISGGQYHSTDDLAKTTLYYTSLKVSEICEKHGKKRSTHYSDFLRDNLFIIPDLRREIADLVKNNYPMNSLPTLSESSDIHIVESALLFEEDLASLCDYIVLVQVSDFLRYSRLKEFRGMERYEVELRIDCQHKSDTYRDKCHFVVDNDGDENILKIQIDNIWSQINKYE